MHKDPPPGLLERSTQTIVVYGLLTGFVVGVVCFGVWSLVSGAGMHSAKLQYSPPPLIERPK